MCAYAFLIAFMLVALYFCFTEFDVEEETI